MSVAADEYKEAQSNYKIGLWISVGFILLGMLFSFISSKYLHNFLSKKLEYVGSRLTSILGGNLNTEIVASDDELGSILVTLTAIQSKLAYADYEKSEIERDKH